jgi:integrase/recombinase XerD
MRSKKLRNSRSKQLLQGFESWLKTLGYSASVVYSYPSMVQGFLYYQEEKNRRFNDWEAVHFQSYMQQSKERTNEKNGGGLSAGHLNKIAQSLETFQRYLLQTEQADLYTNLERLKSISKPLEIFTKEEIKELYEACPRTFVGIRQRAILGLCYGCGLRANEACNLEIKDIWQDKKLLQVRESKTRKIRLVPLTASVLTDLNYYLEVARPLTEPDKDTLYFLLTNRGKKVRHQVLYKSFQQLLRVLDYPQTGLHSLRHSIASHLSESGMPSHQIAQFLGHQTLNSTQIYVHLNKKKR